MSDIIDPADLLLVFDDVDGPKAITLMSGERSVCEPCWKWSEEARYSVTRDSLGLEPQLCRAHYQRKRRGGEWDSPLGTPGRPRVNDGECALVDCEEDAYAKGLCETHYRKDYRARRRSQEMSV